MADAAAVRYFLDRHLAGFDGGNARVRNPFDVAIAHFAFEQPLGVADAIEAEMTDIGLGRDEGHRYAVRRPRFRNSVSRIKANS